MSQHTAPTRPKQLYAGTLYSVDPGPGDPGPRDPNWDALCMYIWQSRASVSNPGPHVFHAWVCVSSRMEWARIQKNVKTISPQQYPSCRVAIFLVTHSQTALPCMGSAFMHPPRSLRGQRSHAYVQLTPFVQSGKGRNQHEQWAIYCTQNFQSVPYFIPVERLETHVLCMYYVCTHTMHANSGLGLWVSGPGSSGPLNIASRLAPRSGKPHNALHSTSSVYRLSIYYTVQSLQCAIRIVWFMTQYHILHWVQQLQITDFKLLTRFR